MRIASNNLEDSEMINLLNIGKNSDRAFRKSNQSAVPVT